MKKYSEERPWGKFEQFTKNEPTTVKIITVKAGQSLSLQYHKKRSEFWRIVAGEGIITIDEREMPAKIGDEFSVDILEKHRIKAGQEGDLVILEIASGEFDEDDIVRLEDSYGRV